MSNGSTQKLTLFALTAMVAIAIAYLGVRMLPTPGTPERAPVDST